MKWTKENSGENSGENGVQIIAYQDIEPIRSPIMEIKFLATLLLICLAEQAESDETSSSSLNTSIEIPETTAAAETFGPSTTTTTTAASIVERSNNNTNQLSEVRLTNETLREVFERAGQIMNLTEADSVMMQLKLVNPRSNDEDVRAHQDNIMLLVVKKANQSNEDILGRFDAYLINRAATDPTMVNWNQKLQEMRQRFLKLRQSLRETFQGLGMQMFYGLQSAMNAITGSESGINGRTNSPEAISIVPALITGTERSINAKMFAAQPLSVLFKQQNQSVPKMFLLFPHQYKPLSPSDVGDLNFALNSNRTEPSSINNKSSIALPSSEGLMGTPIIPGSSCGLGPGNSAWNQRYQVRPLGAFSGMNLHASDRAYTSIGSMVTNTGIHFNLVKNRILIIETFLLTIMFTNFSWLYPYSSPINLQHQVSQYFADLQDCSF